MIFPGQHQHRSGPMPHDNGSPASLRASATLYGEGWLGIGWEPQFCECITERQAVAKYGSAEGWVAAMLLRRVAKCGAVEVPEPEYLK
jgi:hypothetical protein